MYFKTFTLGASTGKQMERAGFRVNSYQEVKSFSGEREESIRALPKDYISDGSIWEEFTVPEVSDRLLLLCRMPIPPFTELWDLLFCGNQQDSFGALCVIAERHVAELITQIERMEIRSGDRAYRKKLLELKTSSMMLNCGNGERMLAAIDSKLR